MRNGAIGALALFAAGLFAACGAPYGKRVPSDLVAKLPYETRIELLEAENQLAVAVDKVDEANNEIDRTRAALRRAKKQRDAADDDIDKANDATSKEVATLAKDEAGARIEFLRKRQELNDQNREVAELALRCAHARFEVARLQAAKKAKVQGAEEISETDFDDQVKACDADLAQRKLEEKPAQDALTVAQTAWEQRKEALAQKTFAARASPYVE